MSTAATNLVIEPGGQLNALWGTVFAFGNLFAIFWLVRAFLNAHPEVAYQVRLQLAKIGLNYGGNRTKRRDSVNAHGSPADGGIAAEAAAAQAHVPAAAAGAVAVDINPEPAAAAGAGPVASRQSIESVGSGRRGTVSTRLSVESIGSGRRHHHRHHVQPIICTPSTEVQHAQSPSAASTASLTPRRTFTANGHASGLDVVPSDSPEGSISHPDSCSSYSSEEDSMRQPVELEWLNMCYSVKVATGKKYIVQVRTAMPCFSSSISCQTVQGARLIRVTEQPSVCR